MKNLAASSSKKKVEGLMASSFQQQPVPSEDLFCSIAVVMHNEATRIRFCLESILQNPGVFVLVIDNQSTDNSLELVRELCLQFPERLAWQQNPRNHLGEARQLALQLCRTPFLGFVDADCVVPLGQGPAGLHSLFSRLDPNLPILALGSGNYVPVRSMHDDKNESLDEPLFSQALRLAFSTWLGHGGSFQQRQSTQRKSVSHLPTCNILYRCEALRQIGGFSQDFPRIGEDLELHQRAQKMGWQLIYEPGFEIAHQQPENLNTWFDKMWRYGEAQIKIAQEQTQHWHNFRMLPLLALLCALMVVVIAPKIAAWGLLSYFVLVLTTSLWKSGIRQPKGTSLLIAIFVITHWGYALGELSALTQLLLDLLQKSRPNAFWLAKKAPKI